MFTMNTIKFKQSTGIGQIILKKGIYLEYVANIFTEKSHPKKISVRKKKFEGKNPTETSQILLNIKLVDK